MCYEWSDSVPPVRKINKEDIVNIAYDIVKEEGMDGINARRIATSLGCSVQPIFHNFTDMEELKLSIYNKIYQTYHNSMIEAKTKEQSYKEMGLTYIRFARDYPEFFKILFMQETNLNAEKFILNDHARNDVIEAGIKLTGLSFEEQKDFHIKVWIFTHGIACLVATKTVDLTDSEISKLLEDSVRQMIIGYKKEKGEK